MPSDTLTLDELDHTPAAPDRGGAQQPLAPALIEEVPPESSVEETVSAAARAAKAANDRAEAAERRIREADQARAAAEHRAQQSDAAAATGRHAVVAAAVETANADRSSARAALKAAYEQNDPEAIADAQDKLSEANARLVHAKGELEVAKIAPRQPAQQQQQAGGPSPEAMAWIDSHPRFHLDASGRPVDGAYRAEALAAHDRAVKHYQEGSREYIRYIDSHMRQFEERAPEGAPSDNRMNGGGRVQDTTSVAGPSNRGGSGGGDGYRTINTKVGPLRVRRHSDGRLGIDPRGVTSDMRDAAQWSGMKIEEWLMEHVKVVDEMSSGGDGGWRQGEGPVYR